MAPLYFQLNLFFSGFLFISAASLLQYCEFILIPIEGEMVSTTTSIVRNQSVASCYHFSFGSKSKFQENEQRRTRVSMELNGNKNAEYPIRISFIKNRQLELLHRSIKCNDVNGTGEFDSQFIFSVEFGVWNLISCIIVNEY